MRWAKVAFLFGVSALAASAALAAPQRSSARSAVKTSVLPRPSQFDRKTCTGTADTDGPAFAAKACYINSDFDPTKVESGEYKRPSCGEEATKDQKDALARAFKTAPGHMRSRLCRLDQVFIAPASDTDWSSWGLWEAPSLGGGYNGIYIAIGDDVLPKVNPADPFPLREEETRAMDRLPRNWRSAAGRLPTYSKQTPDEPPGTRPEERKELALLAVMGHELGHVLFADSNADNNQDRIALGAAPPKDGCFDTSILTSWKGSRSTYKGRRWVPYHEQNGEHLLGGPHLKDVEDDISGGAGRDPGLSMFEVSGKEFVSFFASISPEEDFIETYKHNVLKDSGVAQLIFSYGGREKDVIRALSRDAYPKVRCLNRLGLLTPLP